MQRESFKSSLGHKFSGRSDPTNVLTRFFHLCPRSTGAGNRQASLVLPCPTSRRSWGRRGRVLDACVSQARRLTRHRSARNGRDPGGPPGAAAARRLVRAAIGVSGPTIHGLRHTSATLGATLAELRARIGHSPPNMAMRHQHVAADRDAQLAQRMSRLATGQDWGRAHAPRGQLLVVGPHPQDVHHMFFVQDFVN